MKFGWLLQKAFQLHGALPRRLFASGRAFSPIHMLIEVTYRCNLRCTFCQYLDIIEGRTKPVGPVKGDLPIASIKQRVDEFPAGRLVSFTGGDVSVRKDFAQILAHASQRHRTHFISNGALISEEVARRYVDLAPRWDWQNGLVLVEISLEGDQERHDAIVQRPGSWQATVDGIRHLVAWRRRSGKHYPKLNLKLVVTRDTVDGLTDFYLLARSLGVDIVNFMAEHDLLGHSGQGSRPERLKVQQKRPQGVDLALLRAQLVRAFELAEAGGPQLRLSPYLPIDEFVRHYSEDRELRASEYACNAAWSRLGIGADGRYGVLCPYVRTGDMRQQTLADVWNGDDLRAFRRDLRRDRVYAGCHGCCNLSYIGAKPYGLAGLTTTVATNEAPPVQEGTVSPPTLGPKERGALPPIDRSDIGHGDRIDAAGMGQE